MYTYLENITSEKLGIAFPLTKIHYGINFDLYCRQMLLSPLATLFKQTFEQARTLMFQQRENEAELWSLRLIFERLRRAKSMFAKLEAEQERYLQRNKSYDMLVRIHQDHKKNLAKIAQQLREYSEQFEKIAAELERAKQHIDSCLAEIKELNRQIKVKSNAIVSNCFEIQKAINKNNDILNQLKQDLPLQFASSAPTLNEVSLATFWQLRQQMLQAPAQYLQWLAELSPQEAERLIQVSNNEMIANYYAVLADMQHHPDSAAWVQRFKQSFPELMQNLELMVTKRKETMNLVEELQHDKKRLDAKQAEFEQYVKLAKKYLEAYNKIGSEVARYQQQIAKNLPDAKLSGSNSVDKAMVWARIERISEELKQLQQARRSNKEDITGPQDPLVASALTHLNRVSASDSNLEQAISQNGSNNQAGSHVSHTPLPRSKIRA